MARGDIYTDPLPQNALKPIRTPQVSSLRTALFGYNATSYSQARLDDMTENDMVYAARTHGLTVVNPT
jgi:hypothetical protein